MDLSFLSFLDYVLSPDPVQKRTLMMGFMYHSYLLDIVAGKTLSQEGLRDVVMSFGLIGFTMLVLNRAWWKPSIIISWIAVTLLVMLGARGEILTISIDGKLVAPTSSQQILSSKTMQTTVQTFDSIYNNLARLAGGTGNVSDIEVPLDNGVVARWPRSADGLDQATVYDPSAPIKGYTPAVLTLYAMNRLKTVLLLSLPYPNQGDIVAMRATANRMMAGEPRLPTTKYLTDIFGVACMAEKNSVINDYVNGRSGFFFAKTDWEKPTVQPFIDALKATKFTVTDVQDINDNIYYQLDGIERRVSYPVAGMVSAKVLNEIPSYLRSTRYVSNEGTFGRNDQYTDPGEYATMAIKNAKYQDNSDLVNFIEPLPKSVLDAQAGIHIIFPKPLTEGATEVEFESKTYYSCFDIYEQLNIAYASEIDNTELEKEAGRMMRIQLESGEYTGRIDGTADEKELARIALLQAQNEAEEKCVSGFWQDMFGGTSSTCENGKKTVANFEKAFQENAIRNRLALLAETQKAVYEPGRLFKSDVRDWVSQAGKLLAPIAMWFMALFGGFATGAYAGIMPTFMSFVMAMVIAITPLLFVVGLLVPSFCPGILLTPVLVLLYIKTVEIMFVVVTSVFSLLRDGVVAAEAFSNDSTLADGQVLVSSIYDIVLGLTYTSMFMLAGYIFNMGSPEKILGKIGGLDSVGKIDAKEALQFGGAAALASKGLNIAGKGVNLVAPGGTISNMIAKGAAIMETGELNMPSYKDSYREQKQQAISDIAEGKKRQGAVEALSGLGKPTKDTDIPITAAERVDMAYKEGRDIGGQTRTKIIERRVEDSLDGLTSAERDARKRAQIIEAKRKEFATTMAGAAGYGAQTKGVSKNYNGMKYTADSALEDFTQKLAQAMMKKDGGLTIEQAEVKAQRLLFAAQKEAGKGNDILNNVVFNEDKDNPSESTVTYDVDLSVGKNPDKNQSLQQMKAYMQSSGLAVGSDGKYKPVQKLKAVGVHIPRNKGNAAVGGASNAGKRQNPNTSSDNEDDDDEAGG